jgi:hypothetical protein
MRKNLHASIHRSYSMKEEELHDKKKTPIYYILSEIYISRLNGIILIVVVTLAFLQEIITMAMMLFHLPSTFKLVCTVVFISFIYYSN